MMKIARALLVFLGLLCAASTAGCGGVEPALDVSLDDDPPVASISQGLNACNTQYTCPSPKTCGSWSAYSACGTVGTTCVFNENCPLCGRGGCNNGGYTRYRQRTRTCTLSGGVPCVEWQVGSYRTCECPAAI